MSGENLEQIEINISGWFAVCDAEGNIQALFPMDNLAEWYLSKYGWNDWKLRQIAVNENVDNLFFFEQQHCRAKDDEN